jgi:flagellar protein FlbD
MIPVTRLDGTPMIVNTDQIAWIEYIPDTVISLMNGEKLIVRETPEVIVERVRHYRKTVLRGPSRELSPIRHPVAVVEPRAEGGER